MATVEQRNAQGGGKEPRPEATGVEGADPVHLVFDPVLEQQG
jgi:hypothetical protein